MTDDELFEAVHARVTAGWPTDSPSVLTTPEPASLATVKDAESSMGFHLPPLVRRFYLEIADGGVGPFHGFSPLIDKHEGVVTGYLECLNAELPPGAPPLPPPGVLFLCDFGCAMWALLDCRHPEGQMWWWEEGDRHKLDLTFPQWIQAWLDGHLTHEYMLEKRLQDESWVRSWDDQEQ
ncbi:SMI1/KNR4 family protein [Streptomyces cupreus]|uniref:SMI1/KNR4 family protein n=1 Tax=Streptomyces cupreus TaxID=2759956 RepID=A0A7X1JAL4_9ACTN|nr:SMI1/KNR4 family protein [Streptomyces cupreus]MBC2906770.1 SMI1/KNR4 family protein [Streptomyces cupreus]